MNNNLISNKIYNCRVIYANKIKKIIQLSGEQIFKRRQEDKKNIEKNKRYKPYIQIQILNDPKIKQ